MALNKGRGGGLVVCRRDSWLGSIPASTNWVVVLKPHELTDIKPPTPGDKLLAFLLCRHQPFNTISKTSMSSWFSGKCCIAAVGIGFLTLKVLFGADLIDIWIKDNSDFNPNWFDAVPLKMKPYNEAVLKENSTAVHGMNFTNSREERLYHVNYVCQRQCLIKILHCCF